MKRGLILVVVFCSAYINSFGQRTWFEFDISKDITKKLEFSLTPELRFKEGFDLNEYFFETGLEYKFNKYFSLGGKYRLGNNIKKSGDNITFSRFSVDAKTGYEWKKLEAQLRIRYTNSDDFGDEDSDIVDYMRYKLKLEYPFKKAKLYPYIAYELYRDLGDREFTKSRYEGGFMYKLNKKHRIGLYYRVNDYLNDDKVVNIIGLSYKLKFK